MKKFAVLVFFILSSSFFMNAFGQIYVVDSSNVRFFSSATIEDIAAVNTGSQIIMSTATGELDISMLNNDFVFKKKLMKEHFQEDYMETSTYPKTVFTGTINEKVDYTKDGVTNITVTGTMNMHGVTQTITVPGTVTIKSGIVSLAATFNVKLADYKIKIPSVIGSNISDHIAITFFARVKPYKSKQ